MVQAVNPRTGASFGPDFADTSAAEIDVILTQSLTAFERWSSASCAVRADVLDSVAVSIDSQAASLVEIADLETGLGVPRLTGEVGRTTFQIREFAKAIRAGEFLTSEIDAAVEGAPPLGHQGFIRSVQPLGVVVVFGANNFPFAFSVLGGDTASALAAGCSVIAKAHPSHPQTSTMVFEIAAKVFASAGFTDVLTLIHGVPAGSQVLKSDFVSAGAFTGSLKGGRALFDIASSRKVPIPFYGELGSVNPVVALNSGLADPKTFATSYLDSLLLGNGQFCTKPSILFVPADSLVAQEIADQIKDRTAAPFLSPGTKSAHDANRLELSKILNATPVEGINTFDSGIFSAPAVIFTEVGATESYRKALQRECFGPTGIVVAYSNLEELISEINFLEGALTGSVFAAEADEAAVKVSKAIARKVGRISWNSWPTGVAVSIGQQHGGPYPASTSSLHTSVGLHAISRFLRPVSYQNFPASMKTELSL
jgi:NADP-dependent aldehyde dehydrogenase